MSTGQQWRRRAPLQELIDGLTGHITLVLEETDGLGVVCYYCSKPKYRYVSSESSPRIHPESTSTLKENYTIAQKKKKEKKKREKEKEFCRPMFHRSRHKAFTGVSSMLGHSCNMYRYLCRTKPQQSLYQEVNGAKGYRRLCKLGQGFSQTFY